jgi:uncharacterized tellurite resistance protein B-like protein
MNILRNLFRSRTPAERDMDPKLAAAALLVEAALVDGVYVNIESDMIAEILLDAFDLEAEQVDELISEGETLAEEAVDSFNFTRHVKKTSHGNKGIRDRGALPRGPFRRRTV